MIILLDDVHVGISYSRVRYRNYGRIWGFCFFQNDLSDGNEYYSMCVKLFQTVMRLISAHCYTSHNYYEMHII